MAPLSTKTQQTQKEKKEEKMQLLLLSFPSGQWHRHSSQSQVQNLKSGPFFFNHLMSHPL